MTGAVDAYFDRIEKLSGLHAFLIDEKVGSRRRIVARGDDGARAARQNEGWSG
jgi:hypothetical protein